MPEPREPRSIIEAAEQSAAAGNYASAETLLREAAALQEATLGPLHPDLANTLNNLGVVCEINDNPVDAERCLRRAYDIATTALNPDHPFVATSRKNLQDFCEARGKPVEGIPPPAVDSPRERPSDPEPQDVQPLMRRRFIRPLAIGGLGPAVMLIVILTAVRPWLNSNGQAQSPSATVTDSPRETPAPPQPASAAPTTLPRETARISERGPETVNARRTTEVAIPAGLTVVKARLCADLEDFACDPPDRPVPAGPLFFYTQVKSTSATTIEHRWYRDNRLYQSVELRVQASPRVGDRAFSRTMMTSDSGGEWRVELRTGTGVLLHEERFSVR
ncbi:MAG TPA: DUF2914 domain-containing protein [Vicinamibacterales bacterium]|nr:DUF2914 domain-containing protein [Vicinamibacterales bacterium]